jgi:D-aminoacyl-tRNA deacylase
MRAVIQRVKEAKVTIGAKTVSAINQGLLVLLAIHQDDKEEKAKTMADKVMNLRIFSDPAGKMNLSVKDLKGGILVVSQFTLYGDCRKGNRPSFTAAALPEKAILLYENFVKYIKDQGITVATGEFGAYMDVESVNDGPVTIIMDM